MANARTNELATKLVDAIGEFQYDTERYGIDRDGMLRVVLKVLESDQIRGEDDE